jgi:hypothetical protein
MSRKKLSLDVIENLKNSSSLMEQAKVKKDEATNSEDIEYHFKNLRYPKEWHKILKEAKQSGKTSLNESSYILEAIRTKLVNDNIL